MNRIARFCTVGAVAALFATALSGSAAAQQYEPPSGNASAAPAPATTTPVRAVSLRAGPNVNAPVVGTLHPGDQLEILGTANYGWTQVRSPEGTGWAYGSYLASGIGSAHGMSNSIGSAATVAPSSNAHSAVPEISSP